MHDPQNTPSIFCTFAKNFRVKKILVIRFSSIGDIVLTTPIVRCLKKQLAESEVHYLTKQAFEPVLKSNPYIDKIITIHKNIDEVIPGLLKEHYDHIVDLHKNFRSFGIRLKLGRKGTSFTKLNFRKWLLVRFKINLLPDIHIVDRYFSAVKGLGVINDMAGLDYYIADQDRISMDLLPQTHQKGYVAMVIGGKHKTKQLPTEKVIELIGRFTYPVVILGGPEEIEEGRKIEQQVGERVSSTCGKFNISQSASIVEQARVVITNDTGLMHIAAAFNKPLISIWGNTVPELGMYPYMPQHSDRFRIFEVNGLPCRPCSKIGFEKCPEKHFKCMMDQDVNTIVEAIKKFWGNK
ncbi:MAG: glycosyltransferase family 9 protein [Bacteroidales bacterium]|nr:glycosyltransferase family 9 protein [Bacteroidales bacterium]